MFDEITDVELKEVRDTCRKRKEFSEYEYMRTRDEKYNDDFVWYSTLEIACEMALSRYWEREKERRRMR